MAVDLITSPPPASPGVATHCYGAYALDMDRGRVRDAGGADAVVLATGGVGKVYRYTSNPDTATGDGIAMAWRAGCRVGNMEFIQFHPDVPVPPAGAQLPHHRGAARRRRPPDAARRHPLHAARTTSRLELAPRDIVARAIDFEMKKHGIDHVWLDAQAHRAPRRARPSCASTSRRSTRAALQLGIDITTRAHPRGAGSALHLRRRGHRPGRPVRPASAVMPWARPPTPAFTAPTAWPATRCWSAWCWASSCALNASWPTRLSVSATVTLPPWDESQVEDADEQVVIAHNWDEFAPADVELRRHRSHHQAAGARAAPHQAAARRDARTTTPTSASTATCWNCATWCCAPSSSCAARCAATRAAACTSAATSPNALPVSFPDGADAACAKAGAESTRVAGASRAESPVRGACSMRARPWCLAA